MKQRPTGNSLSVRRLEVTSIIEAKLCGVRGTPLAVMAVYLRLICFRPVSPELTILFALYRVRCINWARNGEVVPFVLFLSASDKKIAIIFLFGYSIFYLKFSIPHNNALWEIKLLVALTLSLENNFS